MVNLHPTPYPDVNKILQILLSSVKEVLGEKFVGMYLYGSLSSGDFEPGASDIDFLVVTSDVLSQREADEVAAMHQRIWKAGLKWSDRLEGSYIPQAHLRRYEKTGINYPTIYDGRFYLAPHSSDWIIQRQVIREHGIVLAGPDPKEWIDPVSADDIHRAVTGILQEWWFPMLDDPSWLRDHGSPYHAYTILTMCRSLHALEHGTIVSKPVAASWAQEKLGGKWPWVIERSLEVRMGAQGFDLFKEALELIRYTMESIEATEIQS